jgi:hypothetical protein
MTTIKLEISEDNPNVLYHFGEALRNLALDLDYVGKDNHLKTTISKTVGDINHTVTNSVNDPSVNSGQGISSFTDIANTVNKAFENGPTGDITPPEVEERDIDHNCEASDEEVKAYEEQHVVKLPWDKRIHSRGKTELADGTLRYARKPSDKTKEEWDIYIEEVEAELTALMAIPVATNVGPFYWCHNESDECGEVDTREQLEEFVLSSPLCYEITKEEYDVLVKLEPTPEIVTPEIVTPEIVTPEIVTPEIVTPEIVTPEIVTPEIVTPEIVTPEIVATGPQNFGELMRFITANGKKLNNDIVKEVLAANGLASIALLAARVDLIPQIHQALLGRL